jgi:hypothetical protein
VAFVAAAVFVALAFALFFWPMMLQARHARHRAPWPKARGEQTNHRQRLQSDDAEAAVLAPRRWNATPYPRSLLCLHMGVYITPAASARF